MRIGGGFDSGMMRARLVCIFAVTLAAWTAWTTAVRIRDTNRLGPVRPYVQSFNSLFDRYDSLSDVVPNGRTLGYASDLAPSDPAFAERRFVLLYALAPAVVDESDQHRFVIADFSTEAALGAFVTGSRGAVRAHPDLGLALVERGGGPP